jgi:hypothetical protein
VNLFSTVAYRLRQRDLLQALLALFALLIFALAVGWPGAGDPNDSWSGVAQARSVAVMLLAVGFGVFGAADPKGWLETLLGLSLVVLLALPLEALAYAASYPAVPPWWTVAQPLLDTAAYFGIGLLLGRATRRVPALWPLLPPLAFVGLLGLSVWLEQPLLNPVASALQVSGLHLGLSLALALATYAACFRGRLERHGD